MKNIIITLSLACLVSCGGAISSSSDSEATPVDLSITDLAGLYSLVSVDVRYSDGSTDSTDDATSFSGSLLINSSGAFSGTATVDGASLVSTGTYEVASDSSIVVFNDGWDCSYTIDITQSDDTLIFTRAAGVCGITYDEVDVWQLNSATGTISGAITVSDSTTLALTKYKTSANIRVYVDDHEDLYDDTDDNGNFKIEHVPSGTKCIHASATAIGNQNYGLRMCDIVVDDAEETDIGEQPLEEEEEEEEEEEAEEEASDEETTEDTIPSWVSMTATNAPLGRYLHSSVWTGTELCIWGGNLDGEIALTNTGSCYNPTTNSWTALSTTNAPIARWEHTAVWTGTDMCIWGGKVTGASNDPGLSSGSCYNRTNNLWTEITTTNAPSPRRQHTAIWTGTKMCIWGGQSGQGAGSQLSTGSCYDPSSNSWSAITTASAPTARVSHAAIWTGDEMCILGGIAQDNSTRTYLRSGSCYNPTSNSWSAMTEDGAPTNLWMSATVWTGDEICSWGGYNSLIQATNTGACYDVTSDSWTAMTTTNAPTARADTIPVVWTGNEMCLWSGSLKDSGGCYDPANDSWETMTKVNAPSGRAWTTAVFTGTDICLWGGTAGGAGLNTGGCLNLE